MVDCTGPENRQTETSQRFKSFSLRKIIALLHNGSAADSESASGGSIPSGATYMELWQTWCMRRTENPENVVRLHEAPQLIFGSAPAATRVDCKSIV